MVRTRYWVTFPRWRERAARPCSLKQAVKNRKSWFTLFIPVFYK